MPTKQHADAPPLSKAWTFALMTGTPPQSRLPGWVEFEHAAVKLPNGDYSWTAAGDRLWQVYGESLTAEARAAGFTPYWGAQQAPTGPAFRRWRDAFLAEHVY